MPPPVTCTKAFERLVDDADAGAREVELSLGIDARQLGRLPADERDARVAAHGRGALDEFGHLLELDRVRCDVVEQHQRLRAAGGDVVDAVRSEVGTAGAQSAALPREDQLRADAVGGAARKRPSPSGCRPANAPKPCAPVDSTAARSRSTTESAVASDTPAAE
jgi:hypothetical protein